MIVNAIVQARMGSKRLPGKVMLEAGGKPLIGHLVDRLRKCRKVDRVIVAGPECDQYSALAYYLKELGVTSYFGADVNDLCARFLGVLNVYPCDAFVRICGDSPLIEPQVVDGVAEQLRDFACNGFVSNVGLKTIPRGQSVEGCWVGSYRDLCDKCDPEDREHAGFPWAYRQIAKHDSLVDTPEDFARVKEMIERA